MGSNWTDDLREKVKALWTNHSATQIAAVLNGQGHPFSRNAVIGLLHRANLTANDKLETRIPRLPGMKSKRSPKNRSGEHHVITKIRACNGNSNAMRVVQSVVTEYKLRCIEIVPRNLTLLDLEDGDCRYPYGDGPITFCGHPKKDGSSFCTPHHHLCWEQPRAPRQKHFWGAAA